MSEYDIDVQACRARQRRLLDHLQEEEVDLAIFTQIEHVQYLSGARFPWLFSPVAALSADGKLTLVAPQKQMPETAAADEVVPYEAQWHSTLRNDQRQASSKKLLEALNAKPKTVGVEFSTFCPHLSESLSAKLVDLEPAMYRFRRRKDPDELARIKKAVAATGKMYQRAREIIEPGVNELYVFNELQAAAVEELGEQLTGTGNDYRCGEKGGPPRNRHIEAGELYILDLGPAFRGYFADNCRTIAVTDTTDEQEKAWEQVTAALRHVDKTVRPGKNARELFQEVQALLDRQSYGEFNHHLGHGIGLFPHETPHLNPHWNDTFEVGDVFTAEPGIYSPQLRAGMRLENDYLVTEDGVEVLSDFPLELKLA